MPDATNLWGARRRFYDPALGRWLSEDPIRLEGGTPNLFEYVGNNPGRHMDPSGLVEWNVTAEPIEVVTGSAWITNYCKSKSPLCGCLTYKAEFGIDCQCKGNYYYPKLSIFYRAENIFIADDTVTPMRLTRWHENKHVELHLAVLKVLKGKGEELERTGFQYENDCLKKAKDWQDGGYAALSVARLNHDKTTGWKYAFCIT